MWRFGALAIASVLDMTVKTPLVMVVTIICAVLLLRTGGNTKIRGDAAVATDSRRITCSRVYADEYFFVVSKCFG